MHTLLLWRYFLLRLKPFLLPRQARDELETGKTANEVDGVFIRREHTPRLNPSAEDCKAAAASIAPLLRSLTLTLKLKLTHTLTLTPTPTPTHAHPQTHAHAHG